MGKVRNNQSGFSAVELLIVLVVLVLVGGAGFLVFRGHHSTARTNVTPATTTTPTKTATTATDPYAGWKTYTSTKEGLSFRYPSAWTAQADPCVNPTTQVAGECTKIETPKSSASSYIFDVTYYWNQADETGSTYVVSSLPLKVKGSKTPLYLAATDVGSGDKLIDGLNLVNKNYMIGITQTVATAIPSQANSNILFGFEASMVPSSGTQEGVGYTMAQYQAQPDYANIVKMFQSLSYN